MVASHIDSEQLCPQGIERKVVQLFQPVLATLRLDEWVSCQQHLVAKHHLDMPLATLLLRQPTLENCMLRVRAGFHVHLNEMLLLETMVPVRIYWMNRRDQLNMRFSEKNPIKLFDYQTIEKSLPCCDLKGHQILWTTHAVLYPSF
jgi:hypothetical protein